MSESPRREPVRVLFHLNGYTKVMLERTEGLGLADGGIVWDIETGKIPPHLSKIGSRFAVIQNAAAVDDTEALREAAHRVSITELDESRSHT